MPHFLDELVAPQPPYRSPRPVARLASTDEAVDATPSAVADVAVADVVEELQKSVPETAPVPEVQIPASEEPVEEPAREEQEAPKPPEQSPDFEREADEAQKRLEEAERKLKEVRIGVLRERIEVLRTRMALAQKELDRALEGL